MENDELRSNAEYGDIDASAKPPRSHLILTVHGIRTYGQWQERLEKALVRATASQENGIQLDIRHYKYGLFTIFSFVVPWLRNLAVKQFRSHLGSIFDEGQFDRIDIVAHSFGTFLAIKALSSLDHPNSARVHTVVLSGSVLSPDLDLSRLIGPGRRIGRIVNDCGTKDAVLLLTLMLIGVGMGGRIGLHGFLSRSLTNRYFEFGHGGYFLSQDGKANPDKFMQDWWLPLLLNDKPFEIGPPRPEGPPWSDRFWRTLGENNSAVTAVFYSVLFMFIVGPIDYFWLEAGQQRALASITQSFLLADRSEQLTAAGDSVSGMLLALEGLPDASASTRPYVARGEVALYHGLHSRHERRLFSGPTYEVMSAKFNPVTGQIALACSDNYIRILDGTTLQHIGTLDQLGSLSAGGTRSCGASPLMSSTSPLINSISFSADGSVFVASSRDRAVGIWNAITWAPIDTIRGFESSGIPSGSPTHQRFLFFRDNEAHVYDLPSRKLISKVSWQGDLNRCATLSPDGKWIATSAYDQNINMWNADSGKLAATFEMPKDQFDRILNFDTEGRFAVTVGKTGDPELWATQPWRLVARLGGSNTPLSVRDASFSQDGARILTIRNNDRIGRIWDGRTGALISVLEEHSESLSLGVFSPDDSLVATTSDPAVRLFDAVSGRLLRTLIGHRGPITSLQFVKQGAQILTTSNDGTVRLWNTASNEQLAVLKGHQGPSNADPLIGEAAMSPNGEELLTSSVFDKSVRLWSTEPVEDSRIMRGPQFRVASVAFSPDGLILAAASLEPVVRLFDSRTGKLAKEIPTGSPVDFVRFSPDGNRLLTVSGSTIEIFDVPTGQRLKTFPTFPTHTMNVTGAVFSKDGKRIATSSLDGTAAIWEASSGKLMLKLAGHGLNERGAPNEVSSVAFSADAERVVTAGQDNMARIWDAVTGSQLLELKGHSLWLSSAVFSPDDKYVLTGAFDQTARLWDARTGAPVRTFAGHTQIITKAIFSPDGKRVITASNDETVRVWDIDSGQVIAVLRGHQRAVGDVASSADGSKIATASDDRTVRLWHFFPTTQSLVDHAQRVAPRCLTPEQRRQFSLAPEPPPWCITMQKWPYHKQPWKDYLAVKMGWKEWLAAKVGWKSVSMPE